MSSEFVDHLDPLFLVSRQLDGDLTEAEVRALAAALADSPELRLEAARMTAVYGMVGRWAEPLPNFDEAEFSHRVLSIVRAEAADPQLARVDAVLRRWSQPVAFDERAFVANVVKQLHAEKSRSRLRLVYRVGAPLAMAAAVAIAVTASFWHGAQPVIEVAIGPRIFGQPAASVAEDVTSVVTFDRRTPDERVVRLDAPMISLGAVGAEELADADEVPSL